MVGQLAGHYQVLEKLGEGGMGEVYKARDSRLNRFVALKVLPPDKVSDPERRARFIREARAASALNHPNIVTVHDIVTEDGCDYIVMEQVAGETLAKKIADKDLRLPQILKYASQIADALARAHAAGIIHRDLKPSNIMITKDGAVKVLDFGLAKQSAAVCSPDDSTVTAAKTSEGVVVGSVGYMSPEQVRGREIDQRSDIFSFGLVLYEMLAGGRAFQGDSAIEVMNAILREAPPELPETAPPGLRHIVTQCLEKDPAARFQSAHDLALAVRAIEPVSSAEALHTPTATRGTKWRFRVAAAAGVAAAGLLVTGLWPVQTPRTRVTQLTKGARPDSNTLAVHDGRILWTTQPPTPKPSLTEFWSISTNGGAPRLETMSFISPGHSAVFEQVNSTSGAILVVDTLPGADRGSLWLANFDGSKPRRVAEYLEECTYGATPDLKTLLIGSKLGLLARSIETGKETVLLKGDRKVPGWPFCPPSGRLIAFWAINDGTARLWRVDRDGTELRPLLPEFPGEQLSLTWSPDGKRLYFTSVGDIYRLRNRRMLGWMRTPKPERLTAGPLRFRYAFEDPRNSHALYSSAVLFRAEAMKLDTRTGHFAPYLGGLSGDCFDFSPDGQWIAYVSFPDRELWKCRRDGSDKVLLEGDMATYRPRWSPDSKRLAFSAQKKNAVEPYRIFTVAADGGRAEPVPGVNGPAFDPDWSPDGKKLVFAPIDYGLVPKQDRHISIVDLSTGEVRVVPGSEDTYTCRWSPDGRRLVADRWEQDTLAAYDFRTKRWTDFGIKSFGFPTWSKDSKHVYGILPQKSLVRLEISTRRLEEIRNVREFRLAGTMVPGVFWTPEGEPVVLADMTTNEIYRVDLEP
jgi:eukaryotic-like serine/threonine-protein kinase